MINVYKKKYVALAAIYLLTLTTLFAQSDFQVTHYTDADGLPQNSVKFIITDNAGYIWLSTEDGLVRFDGNHFNVFSKNELHMSSNRMQVFYRSENKLYCYSTDNKPIKIENGQAVMEGKPTGWLAALIDLTVRPKGLFKEGFDEAGRYLDEGSINMNYPKKDQYRELFVLTKGDSLYRYNNKQISLYYQNRLLRTFPYTTNEDWYFFMMNDKLFSLEKDGIVAQLSTSVEKTKLKGDILKATVGQKEHPKIRLLWNICVDHQVILYTDKAFYLATMDTDGQITTRLLFKGFDAIKKNICSAYYNNQTGVLFLGSSTKGMFVLKPKLFRAIAADSGENIYSTQIEYQPNKLLTTGNRSFDLSLMPDTIHSVPKSTPIAFISLAKDGVKGRFWGARRQWLYLMAKDSLKKIAQWQLPGSINAIYQDSTDKLWVGTIYGELYAKSAKDTIPVLFKKLPDRITYILRTDQTHLYVGTLAGLYIINLGDNTSRPIHNLETQSIRHVFKCSTGEIWVATYGDGFFLLNQGMAISMPMDREKYLRTPHYFIEDRKGYFWIPTNKGLFQVAKRDLLSYVANVGKHPDRPYYYYYDKDNGFNTNEFNGGCEPCAIQLSNGTHSLPSMNGLVLFNPDSISPILPDAGLYIDRITVDSQDVAQKDLRTLSEDFTQMTIEVSTPFLGNHKNLQIQYALIENEASDTLFFPIGENGIITLSRLPYGHYTVIIRKKDGFGYGNYSKLNLSLGVQPKWYHSPWFGIALIFFFPVLGIIASNIRSGYVVRKNRDLKKRIEEKTKYLRERVTMQELIIRAIGHDIRTPLKYHIILSKNIKELSEQSNGALAKKTAILNDSSQQLFQLVENFVHYLKAQNNTQTHQSRKVILNSILENKLNFFKDITKRNRNVLLNIGTTEVAVNSDPELLAIIIHNLIDNATKVVRDGLITTQIGVNQKNQPFLSIADCGPGLDANIIKWINQPDVDDNLSKVDTMPINCGLGLMMVKQLAKLLKLNITVHTEVGNGTTFTLLFETYIPD